MAPERLLPDRGPRGRRRSGPAGGKQQAHRQWGRRGREEVDPPQPRRREGRAPSDGPCTDMNWRKGLAESLGRCRSPRDAPMRRVESRAAARLPPYGVGSASGIAGLLRRTYVSGGPDAVEDGSSSAWKTSALPLGGSLPTRSQGGRSLSAPLPSPVLDPWRGAHVPERAGRDGPARCGVGRW